jgi:phosphatidylserine/phosphatidylglycerophosphate/cardiolipin synthase-like enzyme
MNRLSHGHLSVPAEVLYTRTFRSYFFESVRRVPLKMILISPFITRIPGYARTTEFARLVLSRGDTELMIVTRTPCSGSETLSIEEAEVLVGLGVDLKIRCQPPLHSKVYFFSFIEGDYAAFVGSANFTLGGFERNDESIAFLRDERYRKTVNKELERLTQVGAFPYNHWKIKLATEVKRR